MYRQISEKRKHEPNDSGLGHGGRTAGCESRVGHSVSLRVEREKKSWPAGVQSLAFARRLNVGRGRCRLETLQVDLAVPCSMPVSHAVAPVDKPSTGAFWASIPRAFREPRCLITRTRRQSRNTGSPCFGPEPRQPQSEGRRGAASLGEDLTTAVTDGEQSGI